MITTIDKDGENYTLKASFKYKFEPLPNETNDLLNGVVRRYAKAVADELGMREFEMYKVVVNDKPEGMSDGEWYKMIGTVLRKEITADLIPRYSED